MKPGLVRIIAGKLRGRRLTVPDIADLRPTPDRVRETLFNWLAPSIQGTRCLDLFAGSGVLGFEAASRGASFVEMIDSSRTITDLLTKEALELGLENVKIHRLMVPDQLQTPATPFDIIFLDPPYKDNLLIPTCFYLEEHQFLATNAHVYLEANRAIEDNELPKNWRLTKSKKAGNVFYHLAVREND